MSDQISVYEVPPHIVREHLAAYLAQFGQIRSASSDNRTGGWSFKIILDCEAFVSVLKCLDVEGQKMAVIATSHRLTC